MKTKLLFFSLFLFSTLISQAQIFHVNEDFNSGSLPAGWTTNAITGTNIWSFALDGTRDESGVNNIDGTGMAIFDDGAFGSSSGADFASLSTQSFDNSTNGTTFLEFDYNFREESVVPNDSFYVEVFDGTTWNHVFGTKNNDCGNYSGPACSSGLPHAKINISAYANASCRVRFVYFDGNDWGWYVNLDNVVITSPSPKDIGVYKVISPISSCGLTATDTVIILIKNYGADSISSFQVSYITDSNLIVSESVNTILFPGDSLFYKFSTSVDLSAFGSYSINTFTSLAADGDRSNDTIQNSFQNSHSYNLPYHENFELGDGEWIAYGQNSSWDYGTLQYTPAGLGQWKTKFFGNYNSNEKSYLESPCLNFSTANVDPIITFYLKYNTENIFDKSWMESSIDNGLNWNKVQSSPGNSNNWYNNISLKVWTGGSFSSWIKVENKLTGLAGHSQVRLRIVFESDATTELDGISFDDVSIVAPKLFDAGVSKIQSPQSSCGYTSLDTVEVYIKNYGVNAISNFLVNYSINGNPPISETVSSSINSGDSLLFKFSNTGNIFVNGTYSIKAFTSLALDGDHLNDTGRTILQNVRLKSIPYEESFETGSGGWKSYGQNSTWEIGMPRSFGIARAADGQNAWATNLTGSHNFNELSYLESPCLDFSSDTTDPILSFSLYYFTDHSPFLTNNYTWMEYSLDNGNSWVKLISSGLNSTNWYNNLSLNVWQGQSSGWVDVKIFLSNLGGEDQVKLRMAYNSGSSVVYFGVALDDLLIYRPKPFDAGVTKFNRPVSNCGLSSLDTVEIIIENFGTDTISNFPVSLIVDGNQPITETVNATLIPGDTIVYQFASTIDLSTIGHHVIKSYTNLYLEGNNYNDSNEITIQNRPVLNLPYSESFESGSGGWTSGGARNSWQLGVPNAPIINNASDGSNAWVTNLSGNYNSFEFSFLESPCFDFSLSNVDPVISFSIFYETEYWDDLIWLEYSFDKGLTWMKVPSGGPQSLNWYNNTFHNAWHGSSNGWLYVQNELIGMAGQSQVNFRLVFNSDNGTNLEGIGFDEFLIQANPAIDLSVDTILSPDSISQNICGFFSENIKIEIKNRGVLDVTNPVFAYQVDNGLIVRDTLFDTIESDSTQEFTFTAPYNFMALGLHNIKAWADVSGDVIPFNDTSNLTLNNKRTIESIPFFENFNGFVTGTNFNNSDDTIKNGWKRNSNLPQDFTWRVGETSTNLNKSTGPVTDKDGDGYYMYTEASLGNGNDTALIESPCIDLTSLSNSYLRFYYHKYGSSFMEDLFVDIKSNGVWVNSVDSIVGLTQTHASANWLKKDISLNQFVGDVIKIRFRGKRNYSSFGDMAIDNISVFEPIAQDLNVLEINTYYNCSNAGSLSVEVRLINDGYIGITAKTAILAYQIDNFPIVIDTIDNSIPPLMDYKHSFLIPSNQLSPNIEHNLKVWTSLPVDTNYFNDSSSIKIVKHSKIAPFVENFDSLYNKEDFSGWLTSLNRSTLHWDINNGSTPSALTGPNTDHTTGTGLGYYFYLESTRPGDSALFTSPNINLRGLVNPELSFWYHMYGDSIGSLKVQVCDGSRWYDLDSIAGQKQQNTNDPWLNMKVDLFMFRDKDVRIRFVGKADGIWKGDIAIDDFEINEGERISGINLLQDLNSCRDSLVVMLVYSDTLALNSAVDSIVIGLNLNGPINYNGSRVIKNGIYTIGDTIRVNFGAFNQNNVGIYNYNLWASLGNDTIQRMTTFEIEKPIISSPIVEEFCLGQISNLSSLNYSKNIQWQSNSNGSWQNVIGQNNAILTINPTDTTEYRFKVCNTNYSNAAKVDVYPFNMDFIGDSILVNCGNIAELKIYNDNSTAKSSLWFSSISAISPLSMLDTLSIITNSTSTGNSISGLVYYQESTSYHDEMAGYNTYFNPVYSSASSGVNPFQITVLKKTSLSKFDYFTYQNGPVSIDSVEILISDQTNIVFRKKYKSILNSRNTVNIDLDLDVKTYFVEIVPLDLNNFIRFRPRNNTIQYSTDSSIFLSAPVHDYFMFNVKLGGGCKSSRIPVPYYVDCTVGLSNSDLVNYFTISPNPSNGIFTIESSIEENQEYELEVRNIKGQLVYNTSVQRIKNHQLDLANQSKGVYFIQIRNQDKVFSEKLIIH